MKVNYLLEHPLSEVPTYGSDQAAGADITAVSVKKLDNGFFGLFSLYEYDTGVILEIPRGYYAMLVARSSVSKLLMWLANGIGIIDSDYRGTVRVRFRTIFGKPKYNIGDRVAQLVLAKRYVFHWNKIDSIEITERGEGGFGSTGK